ncbi:MAG TPA: polyprenyl synthetase family protein, partial [Anaerolineales bacterium]|nr:polyprenyl synthetase family protein [Anaerolineales bacterium]
MEPLPDLMQTYLPALEAELQRHVARAAGPELEQYHEMLAYPMGWAGAGAGAEARGKRIRPLLVLLVCEAAGGEWRQALPAAAAVELIHNFSLVHDDIQDNSELRRGRPAVWKVWGLAQAINAGDGLFTLAQGALLDLAADLPPATALQAIQLLHEA